MSGIIIILLAADFTLGTGRTLPTVAAVVGLIGVVAGGFAFARPGTVAIGRPLALVCGLISLCVGGLHAAYAAGSFGTGNGLAGAVVAIVLGVVAAALGAFTFTRSRTA